jgi:two-component system, cell cycle sensor histidine kinase and response regulator CckA
MARRPASDPGSTAASGAPGIVETARRSLRSDEFLGGRQPIDVARAGAALFVAGGVIGLGSLLLTGARDRNDAAVFVTSLVALAGAAFTLRFGRRLPPWAFNGLAATGTILVTVGTYYAGHSSHVYAFLYLWVLIYSAYFLGLRASLAQVVGVGAAFAWVLSVRADLTLSAWLIPIATMMVPVTLTYVLSDRLSRALDDVTSIARSAQQMATRLQALIDAAPVAVIEVDTNDRVVTWNPTAERVFGWSADEVLGQPLPYQSIPTAADSDGLSIRPTAIIRRNDGSERIVAFSTCVLTSPNGEPTGTMTVAVDVTDRRQLEQRLRQTQKMEAIGRLAAGVAHDFNNILLAIRGYSWMLGQSRDADAEDHSYNVDQIDRAVDRAAGLTRQLLAFGHPDLRRLEVIDLAATVGEMKGLLRRLIPEDVELDIRIDRAPVPVEADRGQVEQVILNLAVNSRDAMPDGGRLSILVGTECDEMNETATLCVTDTGVGIDPEQQRYIFEPFYTTKQGQGGTGFGLATVYAIVSASDGKLAVSSQPGRGTAITVRLPLAVGEPVETDAGPGADDGHGTETILLVEDDTSVREPLRQALERYGYRVLPAANGNDALAVFASVAPSVDLVVTDVVMPQMSGPQLVDELRAAQPAIGVLYVSGYPERSLELLNERHSNNGWALLQKPFSPDQLAYEIRARLDERRAA